MRKAIDDFLRDLGHGARLLRRNPGFAAVVLATLALAIGATVTVFSIVDAWLFRPLNFPQSDRLFIAFGANPDRPSEPAVWLPYRAYLGWKDQSRSFTSISAAFFNAVAVTTPGDARSAVGLEVSPKFFETFGVRPLLGRTFAPSDVSGPRVVVLSHGFWQRQFGGSSSAIGSPITLSDVVHEVVGVMPPDFDVRILDRPEGLEFWTPFRNGKSGYGPGGMGPVAIIGRLGEGRTTDGARSEVAAITRAIESGYQVNFNQFVVNLSSLQEDNSRTVRSTLFTVSAAVIALLLVASMNVGALALGRGIGRMREAAIRAALGSGRARLVRQFLAESLLVSVLGGICGVALAVLAARLFLIWNPLGTLPANTVHLDVRALAVAAAAMLTTTVIGGVVPALRVSAADPQDALRRGGERGSATRPTERTQTALLAGQLAMSIVVLVAATLLTRTFVRLHQAPLGFNPENLWVATLSLPNDPFDTADDRNIFYRQLDERLRSIPGVSAVAASTSPPLNSGPPVTVNTGPEDSPTAPRINAQDVTTGFFAGLDVPLVAGRPFDARDAAGGAPVVIFNARASQQIFGGPAAAVGKHVRLGNGPWREIVGVVGNVRSSFFNTLEWRTDPILYRPSLQAFSTLDNPTEAGFGFFLHVRSDRPLTLAAVREAARSVSPRAAVTEMQRVTDAIAVATRQPALRMRLLFDFSIASLLLAAIGVYGVVSQAVAYRRREIAIRIAVGAAPLGIVATMTSGILVTGLVGLGVGVGAALSLGRTLETLLYGVQARDLLSFVVAGAALLLVTLLAALIPALRAVRVDPANVLRAE
jgi:putative ABC transport system permease protein